MKCNRCVCEKNSLSSSSCEWMEKRDELLAKEASDLFEERYFTGHCTKCNEFADVSMFDMNGIFEPLCRNCLIEEYVEENQ